MTAGALTSRAIVPVLVGVNVFVLVAEIFATFVLFTTWAWFGNSSDLVLCGIGVLLAVAHSIGLAKLAGSEMKTPAKSGALGLLPLVSLAFAALVFMDPA